MIGKRCASLVVILTLGSAVAFGQVATGTPPFGSFGGGPFDTINLGNLNVMFSIPVLHKTGRGIPFDYDLVYNGSVWYPSATSGSMAWTPVFNWGWQSSFAANSGYVSFSTSTLVCSWTSTMPSYPNGWKITQSNFAYHDPWDITHPFVGQIINYSSTCTGTNSNSLPSTTADGSGYTLAANKTIITRGGKVYTVPINPGYSSSSVVLSDTNGNQITSNSGGVFTDTLGTTALTVAGVPPSATTFTYTGPSGSESYTMNYSTYSVHTAFGCGILEYIGSVSLVSSIDRPDGSSYSFTYETTPAGNYTGRLASVTLPSGGTISYTYSGGTNGIECSDGSTPTLTRTLSPGGTWTYTRTQVSGNNWKTTVTTPPDPANSGSASDVTTIYFEEDSTTSIPTNNFYETQRVVNQGASTALTTTITCYNGISVGTPSSCYNAAVASPISRTTVFHYLPTSSGEQSETDTDYNSNGLITDVYDYDFGSGAVGSLLRHTKTVYNTSLTNEIYDRPSTVTVYNASTPVSVTSYNYDETAVTSSGATQHISITGSRGNPTTIAAQISSSGASLYRKFTYYDTGMLNTAGNSTTTNATSSTQTTYNYSSSSCDYAFPTSISEPLSLSRSMTWNCTGGVMASSTDENTNGTTYTHNDPLWRLTAVAYPDGGSKSIAYATGSTTPWTITTTTAVDSSQSASSELFLDGLGRPSEVDNSDPNSANGYNHVQATYNALGEVSSVTNPYFTTSSGSTSFAYDALGRTTTITNPDTTYRTNSYTERAVLLTDEVGNEKAYQYDGLGRLQYVCDGIGAPAQYNGHSTSLCGLDVTGISGFLATYGYDVLNNLISVNYSGQTRSFTYDGLSRLVTELNPETGSIRCNSGTYSVCNVYDTGTPGDLYTRTYPQPSSSSSSVTATYSWDTLNRLTNIAFSDGSNGYYYYYDQTSLWGSTLNNPKGRLTQEHTPYPGGSSGFSYDSMGRPTDQWQYTILNYGGTPYHMGYTYDYAGDVKTVTDNTGVVFTNTYNSATELTSTTSSKTGTGYPTNLLTSASYNAFGMLVLGTYGDGVVRQNWYDSRGRLTEIQDGSAPTYRLFLGYYANSSVSSYQDNVTGRWNYAYDAFNRLYTATLTQTGNPNAPSYTYYYDEYGNRWEQYLTAGTGYGVGLSFNSSNRITSANYTYDAAGNVTGDGVTCTGTCWAYDDSSELVSAPGASYLYDAIGNRVDRVSSGVRYDFVVGQNGRAFNEYQASTWTRTTGGLFTYANGETYFSRTDNLGMPRLSTDYTGTVQRTEGVLMGPYGDNFTETLSTLDFTGFAGGDWDTENNGDHFGAREYSKLEGRWLTPDPAGLAAVDPKTPQTWNRYAYVMNNPVSYMDPLGLFCVPGHCPGHDYEEADGGSDGGTNTGSGGQPGGGTSGSVGGGGGRTSANNGTTSTCTMNYGRTTAVGPGQATGSGAFGFVPPQGSVAIDPFALGLFPGSQTNALLGPDASQITFSFSPTPNLPQGFSTTFTLGDILGGPVRAGAAGFNGLYDFDIYRVPNLAAAYAATSPPGMPVAVTVTYPSSLPINCGGPLADPPLAGPISPPGDVPAIRRGSQW